MASFFSCVPQGVKWTKHWYLIQHSISDSHPYTWFICSLCVHKYQQVSHFFSFCEKPHNSIMHLYQSCVTSFIEKKTRMKKAVLLSFHSTPTELQSSTLEKNTQSNPMDHYDITSSSFHKIDKNGCMHDLHPSYGVTKGLLITVYLIMKS